MGLDKLGPFELIELLGEGGVGQVFSARDSILGRQVAVKMLRRELSRDREFLDRFYGEAQRLGDLNHANITTLYGLYFADETPFMAMELVRGHTLKDLIGHAQRLPARASLAVIAQTLTGLAYAHRALVIHRDIKPSNLMVTDGGIVKIMDFGIARVRGSTHMTRAGQAFLTPLYASPEQIKGEEADERSDLYSLGVVFYEMLAGRPPFTAKSAYLLERAHLEEPPPPLAALVPGLDPRVAAAVMRALAKKPEDRFAAAEEFGQAVGARAIRGDAPDILQEFIAASRCATAPDGTRRISRAREPLQAPSLPEGAARQAEARPLAETNARPQPRRQIPVPAAVVGGIAIVLVIGGGYAGIRPALERLSVPGQNAAETPSPRPPLEPAGRRRAPGHPPNRTAQSDRLPSAPDAPAAHARIASLEVPHAMAPPIAAAPKPDLAKPDLAKPDLAKPDLAKPDLAGVVKGAISASLIKIGDRWIELYGIDDPTRQLRTHLRAVFGYLSPAQGRVACWRKAPRKYQCYAGGQDLALLALRNGIARPTPDAPARYRTAVPRRAPHHQAP